MAKRHPVENRSTGENYVYLMNGRPAPAVPCVYAGRPELQVAVRGRFKRRWQSRHPVEKQLHWRNYVWLMNGATITGEGSVRTEPDQNWQVAGVGDFNGDGKATHLWRTALLAKTMST